MARKYIHRFVSSALLFLVASGSSSLAVAQQAKPVAAKAASSKIASSAQCTKKGMACCKGTPTRAAVLAVTTSKKGSKK